MIYTSNRIHPMHFGFVPDLNQYGYLDPFPDSGRNPGSPWFVLKTRCWNRFESSSRTQFSDTVTLSSKLCNQLLPRDAIPSCDIRLYVSRSGLSCSCILSKRIKTSKISTDVSFHRALSSCDRYVLWTQWRRTVTSW